jgi:hypothetical protein
MAMRTVFAESRNERPPSRLINAEYDSDRDGIFDIEYRYDLFEEIETARRIP